MTEITEKVIKEDREVKATERTKVVPKENLEAVKRKNKKITIVLENVIKKGALKVAEVNIKILHKYQHKIFFKILK